LFELESINPSQVQKDKVDLLVFGLCVVSDQTGLKSPITDTVILELESQVGDC
jgi:hypothetical protein